MRESWLYMAFKCSDIQLHSLRNQMITYVRSTLQWNHLNHEIWFCLSIQHLCLCVCAWVLLWLNWCFFPLRPTDDVQKICTSHFKILAKHIIGVDRINALHIKDNLIQVQSMVNTDCKSPLNVLYRHLVDIFSSFSTV